MKYKQYQKYKDSGIEWIGEIPEDWEVRPIKQLGKIITGTTPSTKKSDNYGDEYLWAGPNDLNSQKIVSNTSTKLSKDGFDVSRKIPKNSVMVSCIGNIGKVGLTSQLMSTNQQINSIISSKYNPDFIYYAIICNQKTLSAMANRTVVSILNKDGFGNFKICISKDEEEQKQISKFLDKETTQLDDIISKSQSQINLLQEKRQALITHAVTKGLDPTVPMKDSGIEWFGEIPEHWEVNKIKFYFEIKSGKTLQSNKQNEGDIEVPYITAGNVFWEKVDVDDLSVMQVNPEEIKTYQVQNGDLLVSEGGDSGRSAIVDKINFDCIIQNHVHRLRPLNGSSSGYLLHALRSIKESGWFDVLTKRVTMNNLPSLTLANMKIPVPSEKEQHDIYDFLQKETKQFDNLISKSQSQIKMLQEKRQTLITSAVTGKIDVRNGVAT